MGYSGNESYLIPLVLFTRNQGLTSEFVDNHPHRALLLAEHEIKPLLAMGVPEVMVCFAFTRESDHSNKSF